MANEMREESANMFSDFIPLNMNEPKLIWFLNWHAKPGWNYWYATQPELLTVFKYHCFKNKGTQ